MITLLSPSRRPHAAALAVLTAIAVLIALQLATRTAFAQAPDTGPKVQITSELEAIRRLIGESGAAYEAGDRDAAFRLARAAYLDHFELVEIPLRVIDPDGTLSLEYQFSEWRSGIKDGAPASEVRRLARDLEIELQRVQTRLAGPGLVAPAVVTIASFSILFREGLEALLVIAALLTYLKSQDPGLRRPLLLGALLAIPASVVTWFVLNQVIALAPVGREIIEVAVSLVAAAMMFYVSFWLLNRLDVKHWMEFLKAKVWGAVATGSGGALATLGFLSVYREGAETAVFFQALSGLAAGLEIWVLVGALLSAGALAAIGVGIFSLGARLPVRTFFSIAMIMIMAVSIAVVGNAVRELQVIGWIPTTSLIGSVPRFNQYAAEFVGLHPTLETIAAQAALLAVYLAGTWIFIVQQRRIRLAGPGASPKSVAANPKA